MQILSQFVLSALMVMSGWLGLAAEQPANVINSTSTSDSVELGILELSPNGPEGGYAMPASCDSAVENCDGTGSSPASVTLLGRNTTENGGYTSMIIKIKSGDQVELAWTSENTTECTATAGTGFSTGGLTAGSDSTITEPTSNSATFNIRCTSTSGAFVYDALTIDVAENSCSLLHTPRPVAVSDSVSMSVNSATGNSVQLIQCYEVAGGGAFGPAGGCSSASVVGTKALSGGSATFSNVIASAADGETYYFLAQILNSDNSESTRCNDQFDVPEEPFVPEEEPEPEPESAPTATLQVCNQGGGGCTDGSKTINEGDEVQLTWSSTDADSCTATQGSGFSTGGATSDTDTTITEPAPGTSSNYSVRCSNEVGNSPIETVTVIVIAEETGPVTCSAADPFDAEPNIIRSGDTSVITWKPTTNQSTCTITGPESIVNNITVSSCNTQTMDVSPVSTATYDLTCDSVPVDEPETIRVLPVFQET